MTDDRRLFCSAFNEVGTSSTARSFDPQQDNGQSSMQQRQQYGISGGDKYTGGQHRQDIVKDVTDPLKDLQKLLSQLLADDDVDQNCRLEGTGPHFRHEHQLRSGKRETGRQNLAGPTGGGGWERPNDEAAANVQLRWQPGSSGHDHQRVKSYGGGTTAAATTERQQQQYMSYMQERPPGDNWGGRRWHGNQQHQQEGGNYDHWFQASCSNQGNQQPMGGGLLWPNGQTETQIPVIDKRPGRHRRQLTTTATGGGNSGIGVPSSPSWPMSFASQKLSAMQSQRHPDEDTWLPGQRNTEGQGHHGHRQKQQQQQKEQKQSWWSQTLPANAAIALARSSGRQQHKSISARREATLRTSAEHLDSLERRSSRRDDPLSISAAAWPSHHRRTASSEAATGRHRRNFQDYDGLVDTSIDYEDDNSKNEETDEAGDDQEDKKHWAAEAQATMAVWYRPAATRDQVVAALRDAPVGSFLIRDSQSYPGAYGLAVRVQPPQHRQPVPHPDDDHHLVRHFLIESCGEAVGNVRVRGCVNEPIFASLAELVQCHSQLALALPCQLRLPTAVALTVRRSGWRGGRSSNNEEATAATKRGTTYKVLYFSTTDVPFNSTNSSSSSSSSWQDSVAMAINQVAGPGAPRPIECRMRVGAGQGIKLAGLGWHKQFRLAYGARDCVACALDRTGRRLRDAGTGRNSRLFGLVVRKYGVYGTNHLACVVLGDMEPSQPAPDIVSLVNECIGRS